MKKLFLTLSFCFPILLLAQVNFVIDGKKYSVSGTRIHTELSFTKRPYIDSYLELSEDSIIYHEINWAARDTSTSTAGHYARISLSKKDAKKNKSIQINGFPKSAPTRYLVTIVFKKNILCYKYHMEGEKVAGQNKKKTFYEILFDSKETVDQFIKDYFKK